MSKIIKSENKLPEDVIGSASRNTVSSLIGTNGVREAPRTADSLGSRSSIGTATFVVVDSLISVDMVGVLTDT